MFDLDAVKAKQLPRLTWYDIFAVKGDESLTEDEQAQLTLYFSKFAKTDFMCPGCGSKLVGTIFEQALGLTTFTWALRHGDGYCSKCKYPCRAYHYNVGIVEFVNIVLAVHPDEILVKSKDLLSKNDEN